MLYTQEDPEQHFQESQVELAQTIAGQIATTIENANLFEQAVTRAERERQITDITAKIRASNDPQVIMDTAIAELRAALAESTIKAKQAAQKKQPVKNNGNETGTN
jgi:GAF domain-containing protein